MESKEKYYRKLVEGYLNKTLTKREVAVFFDLLSKGELDFYLEEDMVANSAPELEIPRRSVRLRYLRWSAAAAVLVTVALSAYFMLDPNVDKEPVPHTVSSPVRPGGDHAVLTLSNGEQIILDGTGQAEGIQENDVSVVNNDKGSLQYDLSKLDLSAVSTSTDQLLDKYHSIETPRGGTYHVILPDGSEVWLNSLSKIKFPLAFGSTERAVEMEGEVFFEVAKSKTQPFVVKSRGQEINVLGTSFNVNAYEDEPFVRTTLVSGKIQLNGARSIIKLHSGEEALNTGTNLKIQNGDIEQTIAWKEGYFRFDKVDTRTLMKQISRWYNVNVKYEGTVSDERFVGKIKRSEDIHELLKIFREGGMNISLQGRTLVVKN